MKGIIKGIEIDDIGKGQQREEGEGIFFQDKKDFV
jgi:hypothetical protein